MKTLQIPTLSQYNEAQDDYRDKSPSERGDVQLGDESPSSGWCGRTSASMIYNYFKQVQQYIQGQSRDATRFIVNNTDAAAGPLDLIYPDGEIACRSGESYLHLYEPLDRALEEIRTLGDAVWGSAIPDKNWLSCRRELLTNDVRQEHIPDGETVPVFSEEDICGILEDVIASLNRNTPVLAYTGLSMRDAPKHIVVLSGYEQRVDGLWLHVNDPSAMIDRPDGTEQPADLTDLLEPNEQIANVLDVDKKERGVWGERGARYWLKASRLFEAQQNSSSDEDVWADYTGSEGLTVYLHPTLKTPPSPYASGNVIAHVPVDLGDGATALGGDTQEERLEQAYRQTEQMRRGGMTTSAFPRSLLAVSNQCQTLKMIGGLFIVLLLAIGCTSDRNTSDTESSPSEALPQASSGEQVSERDDSLANNADNAVNTSPNVVGNGSNKISTRILEEARKEQEAQDYAFLLGKISHAELEGASLDSIDQVWTSQSICSSIDSLWIAEVPDDNRGNEALILLARLKDQYQEGSESWQPGSNALAFRIEEMLKAYGGSIGQLSYEGFKTNDPMQGYYISRKITIREGCGQLVVYGDTDDREVQTAFTIGQIGADMVIHFTTVDSGHIWGARSTAQKFHDLDASRSSNKLKVNDDSGLYTYKIDRNKFIVIRVRDGKNKAIVDLNDIIQHGSWSLPENDLRYEGSRFLRYSCFVQDDKDKCGLDWSTPAGADEPPLDKPTLSAVASYSVRRDDSKELLEIELLDTKKYLSELGLDVKRSMVFESAVKDTTILLRQRPR